MKILNVLILTSFILFSAQTIFAQEFVEDSVKYGTGKVYLTPEVTASFSGGNDRMIDFLKLKFDQFDDGTSDFKAGCQE
jgi:hypothetical protein